MRPPRGRGGFMGGCGYNVAIRNRIVEQTTGDHSGRMCDIGHEQGTDFVGNFTHAFVVPVA